MIIKVVNGFYDYDKNRIIEKDEIIEAADKKAEELISKGLAVEVKKPRKKQEKDIKKAPATAAEESPKEDK